MKLLVAVLVLVACSAVRASNPALWMAWHAGAERVAAPVTEEYVDGEQLRNDTITAIDHYLSKLDTDIERQYAWGVNEILQPSGLRFREIVNMQVLVEAGIAEPDQFDYQLWYLARIYDIVVQLAREGEASRHMRFSTELLAERMRSAIVPEQATPRYTLNQLFYGFETEVLERDFGLLRNWLLETFDAGFQTVMEAAPVMEENHRQAYLWPMVRSLQRDSTTVSKYDDALQAHSGQIYWEDYVRARNELWALETNFQKAEED